MQQLGICSWTLGISDVNQCMAKIKSLELDGVQFNGCHQNAQASLVKRAAAAHELKIFSIDPIACKPENAAQATLKNAISFYSQLIDFAVDCGAACVDIQGLTYWNANCISVEECRQFLVEACQKLDTYAQLKKVKLRYKCMNRYETKLVRTASECRQLFEATGHHQMGIVLDSFHMNIEEVSPVRALQETGSLLASYHLSDSNRGGIGSGHINFPEQVKMLKYIDFKGPVILEIVLPHLAPSTPPQNNWEEQQLDNEITRSISVWRGLA